MALPLDSTLSKSIEDFIKGQQANTNLNPDDATKQFSDFIASKILETIKASTVTVTIPPLTVSQGAVPGVVPNPVPISLTGSLS